MNLLTPDLSQQLTFSRALTNPDCLFLQNKLSHLSLSQSAIVTPKRTVIRMGGGPRTYPGGVTKWQWKRMQAKKAKQLLKARLCRERQMYEMRKRAELKAAVSELEKPWEVVERAPNLFSVKADEQLKVLADRFQKPGGFDLWSEKDGPQLFVTPDELPSARFFPKGVVHSIKPYRKIGEDELDDIEKSSESEIEEGIIGEEESNNARGSSISRLRGRTYSERRTDRRELSDVEEGSEEESSSVSGLRGRTYCEERIYRRDLSDVEDGSEEESSSVSRLKGRIYSEERIYRRDLSDVEDGSEKESSSPINYAESSIKNGLNRMKRNWRSQKRIGSKFSSQDRHGSNGLYSRDQHGSKGGVGSDRRQGGKNPGVHSRHSNYNRGTSRYASQKFKDSDSEVYDMSLQQDGRYEFLQESGQSDSKFMQKARHRSRRSR